MTYAPSQDSDQPEHLRSLISLHSMCEEALGPWLLIKHQAKSWYECSAEQADLSLHLAHII